MVVKGYISVAGCMLSKHVALGLIPGNPMFDDSQKNKK